MELLAEARAHDPQLGARTNVIAGFPGETRADVSALVRFLEHARLDAVGVFGYSDEDGTEAAGLSGKVPAATIAARVRRLTDLVEELTAERARERIGAALEVLVEEASAGGTVGEGRAAHQAPEVDGSCVLRDPSGTLAVGSMVRAHVVASSGVDLVAEVREVIAPAVPAHAAPVLAGRAS